MDKKIHETQKVGNDFIPEEEFDKQLEVQRRIEGSQLKKIDLKNLPKWLVVFYFFVAATFLSMLLFGIYVSVMK
jgi:hypothetical protein